MRKFLFVLILYSKLLISDGFSQITCDVKGLSVKEKKELNIFWNHFTIAIKTKNINALKKICYMPLDCSFCVGDSTELPYIEIRHSNFDRFAKLLFRNENLLNKIKTKNILNLIRVTKDENNNCLLSFSYILVSHSKMSEGVQAILSLKRINGNYKIYSAWTIP